jgi:Transglycosylase-like domain
MSRIPSPSLDARASGRRSSRRRRSLALVALVAIGVMTLSGCLPGVPLSQWVPDANNDGQIDATEVATAQQAIADQWARSMDQQRHQTQLHPFLVCVRHFESDRGAFPFVGGYGAQNPTSTASGAYQFLDSTWRGASARAGFGGYARAKYAPWYVQDAVALHVYNTGGKSAWRLDPC